MTSQPERAPDVQARFQFISFLKLACAGEGRRPPPCSAHALRSPGFEGGRFGFDVQFHGSLWAGFLHLRPEAKDSLESDHTPIAVEHQVFGLQGGFAEWSLWVFFLFDQIHSIHFGDHLIGPTCMDYAICPQCRHGLGASVDKCLELSLKANFTPPLTVIVLSFDAIHAENLVQHIQAMQCSYTMNIRTDFGIVSLIPHSGVW
uniref:hypothetical protein n=1 Tax=Synechococcus sp. UW106 TaxID=368495 RepID=UPI001483104D|nr:hypothetical protein [Synechococcus sp. UW106]